MILTFLHIGDMRRGISRYVGQNVLGCGVMGSRSEGANDRQLHPPPLMEAPESGHGRTLGSLTITRVQGTNCTAGKDICRSVGISNSVPNLLPCQVMNIYWCHPHSLTA